MIDKTRLDLPYGYDMCPGSITIADSSEQRGNSDIFALVRDAKEKRLFLSQANTNFHGEELPNNGLLCPLTPHNALALANILRWLRPQRLSGQISFGFGDRLGMATSGHIQACKNADVFPVLAQQSVRENVRTERTFKQVLAHAIFGAFEMGYRNGFGADADHLKTETDAVEAADLGYTFFTCDPGDRVVAVEDLSGAELSEQFEARKDAGELESEYLGHGFNVDGVTLRFSPRTLARAAVKYGAAVEFAVQMYRTLKDRLPCGFDYEVSVDETESPTTPLQHLFVVRELQRQSVEFESLAPRFVGAMEKGVDWYGDIVQFKKDLKIHAAIAKTFGNYRLSLHSGSDKFSLYPLLAKQTEGMVHVKTAGTSYLVALDVAAHHNSDLFREIAKFSVSRFAEDQATYHISADISRVPEIDNVSDSKLPELINNHDSRQVLHVAFGSVLQDQLGAKLKETLRLHEEDHNKRLTAHLGKHLERLGVRG